MNLKDIKLRLDLHLRFLATDRDCLRNLLVDVKDAVEHAEHATDCLEEAIECLSEIV